MLSEGRHEIIKAIRQRLAAANARASAATKTMELARQMLEDARENLDASNEEVTTAKALLKEAEERWEVIDVDGSSSAESSAAAAPSSKRRKVSMSPSGDVRQNDAPADAAAGRGIGGASDASSNAASTTHALNGNGDEYGSLVVVVEGCGSPEVNGTFKRLFNRVYSKEGRWEEKDAEYWIYPNAAGRWFISVNNGKINCLYCNQAAQISETPPENGWYVHKYGKGTLPLPICRIIRGEDASNAAATINASNGNGNNGGSLVVAVEGCGSPEVNGTFRRSANRSDGCPVYLKKGRWKGENANYKIWRNAAGRWEISVNDGERNWLYCNHTAPNSETPPENGWSVFEGGKGTLPLPICRIIRGEDASNAVATINASNGNGDNGGSLVVVVEGCGSPEVNGTFRRIANRSDGCPVYLKKGRWKGENANYRIWRNAAGRWRISVNRGSNWLYCNQADQNSETPPETGWTVYDGDENLAVPICRIIREDSRTL